MKIFVPRFIVIIMTASVLVAIGTVGYMVIEGWSLFDSLYMSVITLTFVGFQEVQTLTATGRWLTMVLLVGSLIWLAMWFAIFTSLIVELDLSQTLRRRRKMREIGRMSGHYIICGAGRMGRQVAQELEAHGAAWVILERDPTHAEELYASIPDAYVIEGDATHDNLLLQAGLEQAVGLIACLSTDTDNLFVCLSARDLSPNLNIVSRANEEEAMRKLYRAGASHVVSPNVSGAIRMASVMLRPSVVSFLDIATRSSDLTLRLEQTTIEQSSRFAGKTLADAQIPQETGLIVIALRKEGARPNNFVFNPLASTKIEPGDEMIVLGQEDQILQLREYVNS